MEKNNEKINRIIRSLSGRGNTIVFPTIYIKITGEMNAALLLNQIVYWSDRTKRKDGYFYKSYKDWKEETTFTQYQVKRASTKLEDMGFISTKLARANNAPTVHYKANMDDITEAIIRSIHDEETSQSHYEKTSQSHYKETSQTLTDDYTDDYEQVNTNREREYPAAAQAYYENNIGMIKPIVIEDLTFYSDKFDEPDAIIIEAMDISIMRSKRNWEYVKAIIQGWRSEGLKTLSDVRGHEKNQGKNNNTAKKLNLDEL